MDAIEGIWTLQEAARELRVPERSLRYMLARHPAIPRRYRRIGRHIRRHRILTTSEVLQLSRAYLASCRMR